MLPSGFFMHNYLYLLGSLFSELPRRKTDGASQFIGNSLQDIVVLESLTFPPKAEVLVPKTQIFYPERSRSRSVSQRRVLLRHLPIQLGFRLRHWWSRPNNSIRKFWRFVMHPVFVFADAKKQYAYAILTPRSQ